VAVRPKSPKIFHLMQLAHRALFRAADHRLQHELGISAVQQGALFVIARNPNCHPSEIAQALDMNKSAVSTLIDRLNSSDLITRQSDPKDGRAQLIGLSPKGEETMRRSIPATKQANAELLVGFDAQEVATIERFLTQIINKSTRPASKTSPSH
jgi:DNA-binding MarR family transcriptional regulator